MPQARAALPKSMITSGGGLPASTGEAYWSSYTPTVSGLTDLSPLTRRFGTVRCRQASYPSSSMIDAIRKRNISNISSSIAFTPTVV